MKVQYQLSIQETDLAQRLLNIFYQSGFKKQELPQIYWSDEMPPIIDRDISDKQLEEIIDDKIKNKKVETDKLLGVYEYDQNTEGVITLYKKTIEHCAKKLFAVTNSEINAERAEYQLRLIVLLHELGHWIAHWLADEDNGRWFKMKDTEDFHEAWAQLMVYLALKGNPSVMDDFKKLADHQLEIYRGYEKLKEYEILQIMEVYKNCRNESWVDLESFIESIVTNTSIVSILNNKRGVIGGGKLGIF